MIKVAAIQLCSLNNLDENLKKVNEAVTEAANQGAKLVVLPENFALMSDHKAERLAIQETLGEGKIQDTLAQLASQYKVTIIGGSMPTVSPQPDRVYATQVVFGPNGDLIGHYHKIHLFDVTVSATEKHLESELVLAGDETVVIDTEAGRVGLSICYDLRFPELYRRMMHADADIMVVPAAFTRVTGEAHWEVLCRARAIENLCYVIAPNQGGRHSPKRETYGHSMIINYWGEVLACAEASPAIIYADLDMLGMHNQRQSFPALRHTREAKS